MFLLPLPFGILTCTNLCLWLFAFLIFLILLGVLGIAHDCSNLRGSCRKCLKTLQWTDSICCRNFSWNFGGWTTCGGMWCGGCYTSPMTGFWLAPDPREQHLAQDGANRWRSKVDLKRFQYARNGDHLMTPFVCDLCVFRALRNRDPITLSDKDQKTLMYIRRCRMDAFWSRAVSTVAGNRRGVSRIISMHQQLGDEMIFYG